jgi:hypothetical protein
MAGAEQRIAAEKDISTRTIEIQLQNLKQNHKII